MPSLENWGSGFVFVRVIPHKHCRYIYMCMFVRCHHVVVNSDLWQLFSFAGEEDGCGLREGEYVRRRPTACAVGVVIISHLAGAGGGKSHSVQVRSIHPRSTCAARVKTLDLCVLLLHTAGTLNIGLPH